MVTTRSYGTPVTVNGIPYLVGNGGHGKTEELDKLVEQAAKWLTNEFGRDIEIRFNSHRESGGAWLKNSLEGFAGNCQVGLGGGLWNHGEEGLFVNVYLDDSVLLDKAMTNAGPKDDYYYSQSFESFEDATADLLAKIDRVKILA